MMNEGQRELTAPPYQFFMLVLCGYALGAMAIEALLPLESELRDLLRLADFGVVDGQRHVVAAGGLGRLGRAKVEHGALPMKVSAQLKKSL